MPFQRGNRYGTGEYKRTVAKGRAKVLHYWSVNVALDTRKRLEYYAQARDLTLDEAINQLLDGSAEQ